MELHLLYYNNMSKSSKTDHFTPNLRKKHSDNDGLTQKRTVKTKHNEKL